jgi:hypothetical protein
MTVVGGLIMQIRQRAFAIGHLSHNFRIHIGDEREQRHDHQNNQDTTEIHQTRTAIAAPKTRRPTIERAKGFPGKASDVIPRPNAFRRQ